MDIFFCTELGRRFKPALSRWSRRAPAPTSAL